MLRKMMVAMLAVVLFSGVCAEGITVSVSAAKSCDKIVGIGFSTAVLKKTRRGKPKKTIKNYGGSGRSYSKSKMPSGQSYSFGLARGHLLKYIKYGCGSRTLKKSTHMVITCHHKKKFSCSIS